MKRILLIYIFLSFLYCSDIVEAGSSHQYGTNAREFALANSVLSSYNKGFNSFTNPSLLGLVKNNEYGFSYFPMSLDRSIQTISISIPVQSFATLALSLFRAGVEDIPERNSSGNLLGNYNSWEGYGMISFGTQFNKKLLMGANIKVLKNKIKNYSASGIGFDFGTTYVFSDRNNFSILLKNMYTKYTWESSGSSNNVYEEKFPLIISLGAKYINPNLSNLLWLIKINYKKDSNVQKYSTNLGLEYAYDDAPIVLRCGFKERGQKLEYSIGLGYNLKNIKNFNLSLDYALDSNIFDEGLSHLISFIFYKK